MSQFNLKTLKIAALLTCHNRRDQTSACLRSLRKQIGLAASAFKLNVFLVDDGCTDGTVDEALEIWPDATIIAGDGNLYWCGGMRKAWEAAAETDPDFYLLLNDDIFLFQSAITSLLDVSGGPLARIIAVGATCDPDSREWTYGGLESDHAFNEGTRLPRRCRTMNANCVLVPRAVFTEIGMFYAIYRHAMGDMDYGYTASKRGIAVFETPFFVAECRRNPAGGTWRDRSLPRIKRFKLLLSPKGLPPKEWLHYCRRNYGFWWPRYVVSPYVRVLLGL